MAGNGARSRERTADAEIVGIRALGQLHSLQVFLKLLLLGQRSPSCAGSGRLWRKRLLWLEGFQNVGPINESIRPTAKDLQPVLAG